MIERLSNQVAYNPVREHINVGFEIVSDNNQQIETIVGDLLNQGFDPALSRVLIFVRTRKNAEEAVDKVVDCLKERRVAWADKVGHFHAGMDSFDREKNYEDFEAGDKVVLIATKAFGMGMDIKNIHYVYHLGPSSNFEDFLQEVGRAGRNKEQLNKAGFSNEKPIMTKCVMTKGDFRYLQDLNHKNALGWNQIKSVQKTIFDYIENFRPVAPNPEEPFPLPFDLLDNDPDYDEKADTDSILRLSLYWLERLGRIRLGLFTPAFLPLKILPNPNYAVIQDLEERDIIKKFISSIEAYQVERFPDGNSVLISVEDLRKFSGKKTNAEFYKILFAAQKSRAISVERYITLEPTKTRTAELEKWNSHTVAPTLEAIFELTEKILNRTKSFEQNSFSGDFLDDLAAETAVEHFTQRSIFWKEKKKSGEVLSVEEVCKKLKEDFINKRAKFAFKIISMLPKMRHKSVIEPGVDRKKPEVVQLVYNGNKSKDQWQQPLRQFKNRLFNLILHTKEAYIGKDEKSFSYLDLILQLKLDDEHFEYLPNLMFISKALGYLKGNGSFVPMGIELFVDDISEIDERDRASKDFQVYQDFLEGVQLKELRLLALECLSTLNRQQQDSFIKKYFSCSSTSELVNLLEEYFGEDHDNLKAFRKEALIKAEEALNEDQERVYNAPLDINLQVIAGPGSGKTHTLTLRVAKLIQKEQINPDQILVLAYNRAVVVELKDRLTRLFKDLGYGKLISRLKVFTFHGFCKFCLGSELDGVGFDLWVSTFLNQLNYSPGRIRQQLGPIKYVFVDEFQDITNERLMLLEKIANPVSTNICVIGDPNQSIYGYDRLREGGSMSPREYYQKFNKIYKPDECYLGINYRSLPNILKSSAELLSKNTDNFDFKECKPNRVTELKSEYCEILNYRAAQVDWRKKLSDLLDEEYDRGKQYRQIAIMFRSNEEVFRAFNEVQQLKLDGIRIRIQGASTSPFRSREFHYFIEILRKRGNAQIPSSFISKFETAKNALMAQQKNWDSYLINLFHCLILEFLAEESEEPTYQELLEFIEEISGKDDGHFSKIFDKHIQQIDQTQALREVIITTMHKVKGVEYDAVIIPPSFSDFAANEDVGSSRFKEVVEEERRLLYVAYTRARYRLVVLKYDRELAIDNNQKCVFSAEVRKKLGVVVPQEIDKLFISWGAREFNINSFNTIKDKISVGDPVELKKDAAGRWQVWAKGFQVGQLRGKHLDILESNLSGFTVSNVVRYTHQESLDYDQKHNADFTTTNWGPSAIKRGYIYLIDFSGYGHCS